MLNSFDLPFGQGRRFLNRSGVVDHVLGGWTVAAAQRYYTSGLFPTTVSNTLGNALYTGLKRADLTGQSIRTSVGRGDLDPVLADVRYFNAGAFALPSEFAFGNASTFYPEFRQPPIFQENLSIQKQFKLFAYRDTPLRLTYRADMFNLFNRTNFGVNLAIGNSQFGRATAPQQGPRIITMGLRLEF
jgi:hypothetical protein